MAISYVAGKRFKRAFIAGVNRLTYKKAQLNNLNIFPVPDGDTGTNMSLTLLSAINEIKNIEDSSLKAIMKALTWGSLMGARGNSGVILAQVFTGFAESIGDRQRIYAKDIANALQFAAKKAYEAVVNPVEGTMLTVIRETAQRASQVAERETDIVKLLEEMVAQAKASLENTPELLPVLREAGVVDSGGLGFVYFLEGMLRLIRGEKLEDTDTSEIVSSEKVFHKKYEGNNRYCAEFILEGKDLPRNEIKEKLIQMGNSLLIMGNSNLLRVHIHTFNPEELLRYVSLFGNLSKVKVDDMLEQHRTFLKSEDNLLAVIAVVPTEEFKRIFINLGADRVIKGGQTMNPTVKEVFTAIEEVPASKVIVLPNNNNVASTSVQAAKLTTKSVEVVISKSLPEGISALMAFNKEFSFEDNLKNMNRALGEVKSGEVVRAVRSTAYKDKYITKGDILGVYNRDIKIITSSVEQAVLGLLNDMVSKEDELITLFYGKEIKRQDADALVFQLKERFAEFEIEIHPGGQTYSLYIVSVE
ncbi:MAG: hypothetical protein DRP75_01455 [Candidatus Omnitrophota bacterium]|nr:MAG: hypothetical protein DRP75_01455 [Candidatus Omnitrophota bacterium]